MEVSPSVTTPETSPEDEERQRRILEARLELVRLHHYEYPIVTEIPLEREEIGHDSFIDDLQPQKEEPLTVESARVKVAACFEDSGDSQPQGGGPGPSAEVTPEHKDGCEDILCKGCKDKLDLF